MEIEESKRSTTDVEDHHDDEFFNKFDEVPSWKNQVTWRAIVTSAILSFVFNIIVCKLNLTTGVIPSMNVAAGLLGFGFVKFYTSIIEKYGFLKQPFNRQENTVIQTCVVASSGIAFSSGTASYILGMTPRIASVSDNQNTPSNVKELTLLWLYVFLFVVSFVGLFSIVPLRKVMILKYKLTYPSGTATAYLINSFHTPKGAKLAKKQVASLLKAFCFSFIFACFQWFFAAGDDCGFSSFPTFGIKAYNQRFYFDFSPTYVGTGMICPYMVNISLLIGAILSWGIMWPLIAKQKGNWYPTGLKPGDLHGLQGYRVFLGISVILGDGLFHVVYMIILTTRSFIATRLNLKDSSSVNPADAEWLSDGEAENNIEEKRKTEYFLKDQIPNYAVLVGYIGLALISITVVPFLFQHRLKWYHILVCYMIAPIMAFCNAYGAGLTDWSLASSYGKLAIIVFSAWVGLDRGGIIAGLAACGVMMSITSTASDLMQDFKTGYLTLASPRSMFLAQVIGTAMGCVMTPSVFWFFYKTYPQMGDPESKYPAPYAATYRGIADLGAEGVSALPKNCLKLAIVCFFAAILVNVLTKALEKFETKYRIYRFVPSPMCMAIPFYLGGYFAIDMCVGSLILFIWERKNKKKAKDFGPAVASGLICGDSLWSVPAAILALAGAKAPICMKFVSNSELGG